VIPVDKVHVGISRRTEQHRGAGGVSGGGVSRGIVLSEVSFYFNDAGRPTGPSIAHQNFTEKLASDASRRACEEGTIERAEEPRRGGGKHRSKVRMQELEHKVKMRGLNGGVNLSDAKKKPSSFARKDSRGRLSPHEHFSTNW
jgi:hypothetical protein